TLIVGTGAAGYSAADRLHQFGHTDIAIITEGRNMGTSRNTGSDKQTYYKLTLSGDGQDSFTEMAKTLFDGQAADGDLALCEAVNSVPCFLHLAELGVPFPTNRWGEYVGYKTDHDPRERATSAGPLTSKLMTEALERSVAARNITVLDHHQMIHIFTEDNTVQGVLCLNTEDDSLHVIRCANLVLATGGPAGLYADSVYPTSQHGASGIAFAAGVGGKNLTEWQYGMASVRPRWNVSGTYMQSLPRFVSTREDGSDPQEFLTGAFKDRGEMLSQIFLKGYQWPFDSRKALDGSSRIDLLVYREKVLKGRRVFLDYRSNPDQEPICWDQLSDEAYTYLSKAGALQNTPFARLAHMNQPAVDFYRSHNVDLEHEMLEIAVCAQHNNGGLVIDNWWRTNVNGIFAIGEAAGSHGVYRPGGSALNAGQAGALRAAKYIAAQPIKTLSDDLPAFCNKQLTSCLSLIDALRRHPDNTAQLTVHYRRRMSAVGGAFRSAPEMIELANEVRDLLVHFDERVGCGDSARGLANAYRLYDQLITMSLYLDAMADYAKVSGLSRGSSLYQCADGALPRLAIDPIPEVFRFLPDDGSLADQIQEVYPHDFGSTILWRPVRPLPDRSGDFFENIWRSFRENKNIID
ncbi:MAG: FAD-binding protein, partial [Firmicutes bacterium]|nr:FAD-binding protein [Bacillota bacterium]